MKNGGQKRLRSARVPLVLALFMLSVMLSPARGAAGTGFAPRLFESDEIELYQALLDLQNPWTVMCVAAHPDDEDGATLTVLRRKLGAHTVTLFTTYGEGGQNATGPELYEELGAIRARETEEASRIQGSEPWFLALPDFGFSKSAEEAFSVWNHTEALRRMVLKIRELRPDIIITNHDTTSGHGHHQATGRLIMEAFDAAADPQRFPEQLGRESGLRPWQAQRLFVRIFNRGDAGRNKLEEEAEAKGRTVTINPNERDPLRNSTYAEQALRALHRHASQGPWPQSVPAGGASPIRYRLAREAKQADALPSNAQTFFDGLRAPEEISQLLGQLKLERRPLTDFIHQRQRIFYTLAGLLMNRRSRPLYHHAISNSQLIIKRIDKALAAVSGIKLTVSPRDALVVPNSKVTLDIGIFNQGETTAFVHGADSTVGKIASVPLQLPPKTAFAIKQEHFIPDNALVNVPHSAHLYDGLIAGKRFEVRYEVEINHVRFPVTAWARVDVAPPVEIKSITPSPLVLTPETIKRPAIFNVRLVNHRNSPFAGEITAGGPNPNRINSDDGTVLGFGSGKISKRFKLAPGETKDVQLQVGLSNLIEFTRSPKQAIPNLVSLKVKEDNSAKELTKQRVHVVYSDARIIAGLRVGYIRSFDDTLRDALNALGVNSKELSVDDIRRGDLSSYDTIIVDNRGYQAHPELVKLNSRLLDYLQSGGNLIVFYHRTNEWNPDPQKARPQLAPYPITIGNSRVTDETAPIEFTVSGHALLNFPNKISQEDFARWIQERGLYFPREWDERYSAPLATNDKGEPALRGGLLAADYGRGRYIYTSFVWYRQLRAGVPGAYRILANMISYGRAAKGSTMNDER